MISDEYERKIWMNWIKEFKSEDSHEDEGDVYEVTD